MDKILECVPNFSEGIDTATLDRIAAAISSVEGVWLLHRDQSPAANRTVMTFAGKPEGVTEAAFRAISAASECINMRTQQGVHPRIGATDVCPLVPLKGMTMEETDHYAQALAKRVGEELNIPVYCYEFSQKQSHRKSLPQIRKGQYEGLAEKMKQDEWKPDYGPAEINAATGATVIGARKILVAFNISLDTKDITQAEQIAAMMRASSRSEYAMPMLRAIGWYMADYGQAQVSFNLLDYHITSPLQVWQRCRELAAAEHIKLGGSELIGLMPEICLLEAGLAASDTGSHFKTELLQAGIDYLGLDKLKAFPVEEKILEYALKAHSGNIITLT